MPLSLPPVYPILDTTTLDHLAIDPLQAAEAFLEAGATILQFRHKSHWDKIGFERAKTIATLCRQANALFVINDRADYAHLLNAALHVGQNDLLPADTRKVIGPHAILGFSTHNPTQLTAPEAAPADYLAFGPVFPTTSKDRPDPTTGPEAIGFVRALTQKPLVAIGGITRDNAPICWQAGADSVAVISDLLPRPCSRAAIRARFTEWIQLSASVMLVNTRSTGKAPN